MTTTTAAPPLVLSELGPIAQLRAGRLTRRLVQLYVGLVLYGFSIALMVRSDLGLAPWDVLHSGLTKHFPIDIGQALVIVSFVVMLAWIPLREMPGLGTISNKVPQEDLDDLDVVREKISAGQIDVPTSLG